MTQPSHQLDRRSFLKSAVVAATLPMVGRAMSAENTGEAFPPGRYVDIHTHLGQEWGNRPALGAEGLLEWMDSKDISQAAVLPLIAPESWDHPITTDYVLRETEAHRDRLIPWCSIDPRTINLGSYSIKLDLLKRYRDAGAKGFGEHKVGVPIDDPRNIELFAACAEVGFPVLFHLDTHRNTDKPGLPGLAKVLEEVPGTNFIGHAQGWWASISGGLSAAQLQQYPDEPVKPGGAIDSLMDRFPNIYGDLSAGSGANAILRDLEFGREFILRRQDRLLFGTDYLAPEQKVPQFGLYDRLQLPKAVQRKVFRDNARRLMGLV